MSGHVYLPLFSINFLLYQPTTKQTKQEEGAEAGRQQSPKTRRVREERTHKDYRLPQGFTFNILHCKFLFKQTFHVCTPPNKAKYPPEKGRGGESREKSNICKLFLFDRTQINFPVALSSVLVVFLSCCSFISACLPACSCCLSLE